MGYIIALGLSRLPTQELRLTKAALSEKYL
jgi:hypothetical protein